MKKKKFLKRKKIFVKKKELNIIHQGFFNYISLLLLVLVEILDIIFTGKTTQETDSRTLSITSKLNGKEEREN